MELLRQRKSTGKVVLTTESLTTGTQRNTEKERDKITR